MRLFKQFFLAVIAIMVLSVLPTTAAQAADDFITEISFVKGTDLTVGATTDYKVSFEVGTEIPSQKTLSFFFIEVDAESAAAFSFSEELYTQTPPGTISGIGGGLK